MNYKMRDPGRRDGFKGFDNDKHPRDNNGRFAGGDVAAASSNVTKKDSEAARFHTRSEAQAHAFALSEHEHETGGNRSWDIAGGKADGGFSIWNYERTGIHGVGADNAHTIRFLHHSAIEPRGKSPKKR